MPDAAAPTRQTAPVFGAYGKMPALGDFFRLRVAQEFVTVWDGWLQAVLLSSRQILGGRFEDCYMTAPVWRFVLPPGMAGGTGMIGVLMPSVDRVGRLFPLTLVGPCGPAAPLRDLALHHAALDALEALALAALGDDMTRELLAQGLDAIPHAPAASPARLVPAGQGHVLTGGAASVAFADLTLALGPAHLAGAGVWSTHVDDQPRIGLWPELPCGAAAAALFDMDAPLWTGDAAPSDPAEPPPDLAEPLPDPAEPPDDSFDILDAIGSGPLG